MITFSVSGTVTSMGLLYDIFQRSLKGLSQLYLSDRWENGGGSPESQSNRTRNGCSDLLGFKIYIHNHISAIFGSKLQISELHPGIPGTRYIILLVSAQTTTWQTHVLWPGR